MWLPLVAQVSLLQSVAHKEKKEEEELKEKEATQVVIDFHFRSCLEVYFGHALLLWFVCFVTAASKASLSLL